MSKKKRTRHAEPEASLWDSLDYLKATADDFYTTNIQGSWEVVIDALNKGEMVETAKRLQWNIVHRLCFIECLRQLKGKGLTPEEIQEKSIDCTVYALYDRPSKPAYGGKITYTSIAAWCHYSVIETLYDRKKVPQEQFEREILLLDEDDYYGEENGIY